MHGIYDFIFRDSCTVYIKQIVIDTVTPFVLGLQRDSQTADVFFITVYIVLCIFSSFQE